MHLSAEENIHLFQNDSEIILVNTADKQKRRTDVMKELQP